MSALQIIGTFAGSAVGAIFGPSGAITGASIGYTIGTAVNNSIKNTTVSGPQPTSLTTQISSYGIPLPRIFGSMRVAGNVIWAQPIQQTTTSSGGGKGGGAKAASGYTYSITMAIAVCQAPVSHVLNVWADSQLLTFLDLGTAGVDYNFHFGGASSVPDPIIESFEGVGNVPSYKDTFYLVVKDFQLQNYGNRIPNFTFEMQYKDIPTPSVETQINAVNIIPGDGEFVYDTTIQKYVNTITGVAQAPVNMNNSFNEADAFLALDQLQDTLPNLEWISIICIWFATSLDAGACTIVPKVRYSGNITTSPDVWNVGTVTRSTAEIVLFFGDGTPTYQGTPSDRSICNFINEIKNARGLNVMFCPLIYVDTITPESKPGRGAITPANATDAATWFTKTNGYNAFIEHYLNLSVGATTLKDNIDAFMIGASYTGMTSATFTTGVYPGVTGFQNIAAIAKSILPSNVKVVYGANYTEYHSDINGWYNMDPLWADSNVDIVGIEAYFPITPDLDQSVITYDDIYYGWAHWEGYEYFFDNRPNTTAGTSNLVSNPFTTTSSSPIVEVDLTGFYNANLTVGQEITFAGCTGNPGGISNANINGLRTVLIVVDGTHVKFTAGASATSSTSAGGSSCTIDKPKYYSSQTFAWKDFLYWWANTHTNPDSSSTSWTVKMKPLWFTQFGFSSIDGTTNQPAANNDPRSIAFTYPRQSKQQIDNYAQRLALQATEDFLTAINAVSGQSNLVPLRFAYCWDARPYPTYPNFTTIYPDYGRWATGFYMQGKLGTSTTGAIVSSLLETVGITSYDVSTITDIVDGYCIPDISAVRDNISDLSIPFFFDVVESSGVMKFVKRGSPSILTIPQNNLVPPDGGGDIRSLAVTTRTQEIDLPQKYSVSYYDAANSYEQNTQIAQRQTTQSVNQTNYSWNLALGDQAAQNIANQLLYTTWQNRTSYQFTLPPQYCYIEPTDVITLTINNVDRILRVVTTDMQPHGSQAVTAVTEDAATYNFYAVPGSNGPKIALPSVTPTTLLDILDLPAFPSDSWTDVFITMADAPLDPNWNGAIVYRSDDGGEDGGNVYNEFTPLLNKSNMGVATTVLDVAQSYTWDFESTLTVVMINGALSSSTELGVLNGANSAVLGTEVIQFLTATLTDTDTYELSGFLRGRLGTEDQIGTHVSGEYFVMLDLNITRLAMPLPLINALEYYKAVSIGATLGTTNEQSFTYHARQLMPYSPVYIIGVRDVSHNLTISWIRRTRVGGALLDGSDVPLSEETEAYSIDILNGSTVVRTISSTSPTCIYSAANQVTDFGSTQSSISIKVYQISATVGRGIPGITTV